MAYKVPMPSGPKLAAEDRRDLIMKYALAGLTHRQIVQALKDNDGITISRSVVTRDIKRRLTDAAKDCPETPKYRELHRQRLEKLFEKFWDLAMEGDNMAALRVVNIMERQARLLGLDMPVRTEISGPEGGAVPVDFRAIIARFEAAVGAEPPTIELPGANGHTALPQGGAD